jgi:hypothetical protein
MMTGTIYSPLYLVHPETKRICDSYGIKMEWDPVHESSELRSYKERFLDKRPEGDKTVVTSKIIEATRMRSRDRRMEFLVWVERQTFIDALGNEVPFTRTYCGIYKIPKVRLKTVSDGQGGTKTAVDDYTWLTMYEVPFNEDNAKKVRELADDQFSLKTYIQTDGIEEIWTIEPKDFDKWAEWPFDALLEFARTPGKFLNSKEREEQILAPYKQDPPATSKNELFNPEVTTAGKNKTKGK